MKSTEIWIDFQDEKLFWSFVVSTLYRLHLAHPFKINGAPNMILVIPDVNQKLNLWFFLFFMPLDIK
ncbi:MAG: hypothetical protein CMH46_06160 [Muricauda sp.]|nr:hypothetical protein [Allomuricauda sp.]|tara:strand:- start:21678 stop:21878 length:201 start_codon:yes stop_codon:yes gene_type:complete